MDIAIIGGGAAGLMAAYHAAQNGARVTIYERNDRPGIKLNLTGKGRCNVTNDTTLEGLIANTPQNGKFLYSAFSAYTPQDVMQTFAALGAELKTERGQRVFPVSDRAKDITAALQRGLRERDVRIVRARICEIVRDAQGHVCALIGQDGVRYTADRVILATGGKSYPKTGSSGDGYALAQALGHTVTTLRPSLVALRAEGDIPARLEGLSLRNVRITLSRGGKVRYTDFGELVFTRDGLSGPVILSGSAHLRGARDFPAKLDIDLKPALDAETLDARLLRDFSENLNRDFSNALSALLPSKLIPVVIELSGIAPNRKVHTITRTERKTLLQLLKCLSFTITATGPFSDAIITSGGISVKEVDPKTMQSKLVPGLYFAGEVLDVDAYTGGFNLQIAWSTAFCAAQAVTK